MKEKCDRKCETCDLRQHSFCSTQMLIALQDKIEAISADVESLKKMNTDKVVIMPIGNEDGKSDNV